MKPGTQLYVTNTEHLNEQVIQVKNSRQSALIHKPEPGTGLWTSTWRKFTQDSDWVEWCRAEDYGGVESKIWWLLTPKPKIHLYVIDSTVDFLSLLTHYPLKTDWLKELNENIGPLDFTPYLSRHMPIERVHFACVDFERLAQDFDGIWLTSSGNAATHLSFPHSLNSWDCESILWFRWCFTNVERLETPYPVRCCEEG